MTSSSFAWRLISGDFTIASRKSELSEKHIIQLKAIFNHYDDDRDGFINTAQLTEAVESLGFSNRDRFIKKFCNNMSQLKIQGLHAMSFKTDLKTFINVINREIKTLQSLEQDLDALFRFVDVNHSGYLTRKELRYILVEIASPSRLSPQEFTRFIRGIKFTKDTDSVLIGELKKELLLQY